jgi:phosphate transport system substrate-binding protein
MVLCCLLPSCSRSRDQVTLQGAGGTLPAPLYKRWFLEYYRAHPNVRVSYQAVGSGAGIRQFSEGLTDFGATDSFMSDKEIKQAMEKWPDGLIQLPMTAGMVVLCYNVPGAPPDLRLTRRAYADIFLGKIDNWNDRAIAESNPGATLPDLPITVVRRAEGSGTTYVFTNHLSAISPEWKQGPGKGKSVVWPVGLGAKGNAGVAALIQQTPGAIGYLEYGYAELSNLPMAALQNKAALQGKKDTFIKPTPDTGLEAIRMKRDAESRPIIPEDFKIEVPDPEGENAYPIATYTWMIIGKKYHDARKAAALRDVLTYCLSDGQKVSAEIGYLPLPEELAAKVQEAVNRIAPPKE